MASLLDRLQTLQEAFTRAANSPQAQQVRTVLSQDLPAWLLELGTLTPVEVQHVSRALNTELANLIHVCAEEQKVLGSRDARNPLAVELSLARIGGVAAPLEATLSYYAQALRRSDPRLAALPPASSAPTAPAARGAPAARPHIQASDCRKVAEDLRATLHDAATGAQRVQATLRGRDADDPTAVAGAIAQAQVLVGWLREARNQLGGVAEASVGGGR